MNQLTRLAIQGYLEKAEGQHPSTVVAIPFTLAEWAAILKDSQSEAEHEDTKRLSHFAADPFCDEYNGIDLHERAYEHAVRSGRKEPNEDDYLEAVRDAIDAGRDAPSSEPSPSTR